MQSIHRPPSTAYSTLNAQHRTQRLRRRSLSAAVIEVTNPSSINHLPRQSDAKAGQPSTIPQFVWRIAEFIIGGVFIYAGVVKVLDPVQFATDIDNYKILPWTIGVRLAFYLPWLEIFCGLALITRKLYLGGLSILTALILIFIVATIIAKVRGTDITCGCFGHASDNLGFAWHLALDFALLAGVIALLLVSPNKLNA